MVNRQQQLDRFSLDLHRVAVAGLRREPASLVKAQDTLRRWRERSGQTRSDAYLDQWESLLRAGVDAIERATCNDSDEATVLRSVSPLGALVSQSERMRLLRQARS